VGGSNALKKGVRLARGWASMMRRLEDAAVSATKAQHLEIDGQ
jgi:hypothetical protein